MHSTDEYWMPVVELVGLYDVSNFGNIKSLPSEQKYRPSQCGIVSKFTTKYGYNVVTLTKNGERFYRRVARIVAIAFVPNPENKPCVNHKNGIKTDDRAANLEWVTYSENELHSYTVLGKNIKGNKKIFKNVINPKSKKVICIENNITFNSIKDAAKSLNLERANITAQIKGRLRHTGGLTFKFV